jgi:hypothetical protein
MPSGRATSSAIFGEMAKQSHLPPQNQQVDGRQQGGKSA